MEGNEGNRGIKFVCDIKFNEILIGHDFPVLKELKGVASYGSLIAGHSLADLRIISLEQSKKKNPLYRKQRETYHINRFNTFNKGINRQSLKKRKGRI